MSDAGNVVPLRRETPAAARMRARLAAAAAPVKAGHARLVDELVAAMVEAIAAGVDAAQATAIAIAAINDLAQAFLAAATAARDELDRLRDRKPGETT